MSWKTTTKGLNILSAHCLDAVENTDTTVKSAVPKVVDINVVITAACMPIQRERIDLYPTVFDGQIRVMQGEEFHISVAANTQPFCIHTL